jgi:hypothetical protein
MPLLLRQGDQRGKEAREGGYHPGGGRRRVKYSVWYLNVKRRKKKGSRGEVKEMCSLGDLGIEWLSLDLQ